VQNVSIMIAAVVLAVGVMLIAAGPIADFVEKHPTVKMLALSFLLLIGVTLVAEGLGQHFPKGYIYFAMGFAFFVEMLNLRLRKTDTPPVELREPYVHSHKLD
jgi:predicted tellurium resistance membrane protein TerC